MWLAGLLGHQAGNDRVLVVVENTRGQSSKRAAATRLCGPFAVPPEKGGNQAEGSGGFDATRADACDGVRADKPRD